MIVEAVLNLFKLVISVLLTPLSLVLQPLGSFAGFMELLSYASIFIPMMVFAQVLGIWVGFHMLKFGMIVINWLIAKIPTIS